MKYSKQIITGVLTFSAIVLIAAGCSTKSTPIYTPSQSNTTTQSVNTNTQQSTISYQGQDGKTALDLLKAKYQVQTKEYTGLGEFVQSINGVTPDKDHFWAFYVNGKSSDVGAGQYKTKSSDLIEWKLDAINSYPSATSNTNTK